MQYLVMLLTDFVELLARAALAIIFRSLLRLNHNRYSNMQHVTIMSIKTHETDTILDEQLAASLNLPDNSLKTNIFLGHVYNSIPVLS